MELRYRATFLPLAMEVLRGIIPSSYDSSEMWSNDTELQAQMQRFNCSDCYYIIICA